MGELRSKVCKAWIGEPVFDNGFDFDIWPLGCNFGSTCPLHCPPYSSLYTYLVEKSEYEAKTCKSVLPLACFDEIIGKLNHAATRFGYTPLNALR